jgi:hypothetical protein
MAHSSSPPLYHAAMRFLFIILATIACSSSFAHAQSIAFSARTGLLLNFSQASHAVIAVQIEARNLLVPALTVRAGAGFSSGLEFTTDALIRFDGRDEGPMYLGLGFGLSRAQLEGRALVGYEWTLSKPLRLALEGVVRFPARGDPRLEFAAMLVWLLP